MGGCEARWGSCYARVFFLYPHWLLRLLPGEPDLTSASTDRGTPEPGLKADDLLAVLSSRKNWV